MIHAVDRGLATHCFGVDRAMCCFVCSVCIRAVNHCPSSMTLGSSLLFLIQPLGFNIPADFDTFFARGAFPFDCKIE